MLIGAVSIRVPRVVPASLKSRHWLALAGRAILTITPRPRWARGTLKTELLPPFANLQGANLEVAYYFDTHFNLDRRHSALSYRSPHHFKRDSQLSLSPFTVRSYWTISVCLCNSHGCLCHKQVLGHLT